MIPGYCRTSNFQLCLVIISYNVHNALAEASQELGIFYNTGEGGLHRDLYQYGKNTIVQVASGRFGVHKEYLEAGAGFCGGGFGCDFAFQNRKLFAESICGKRTSIGPDRAGHVRY